MKYVLMSICCCLIHMLHRMVSSCQPSTRSRSGHTRRRLHMFAVDYTTQGMVTRAHGQGRGLWIAYPLPGESCGGNIMHRRSHLMVPSLHGAIHKASTIEEANPRKLESLLRQTLPWRPRTTRKIRRASAPPLGRRILRRRCPTWPPPRPSLSLTSMIPTSTAMKPSPVSLVRCSFFFLRL